MSYATPANMETRFDVRRLGQLVADDGSMQSASELLTDPNLQAALDDAASMIDASCLRGGRYAVTDLQGIITTGGQVAALLIRINCDLAYGLLVERRGYTQSEAQSQAPGFSRALAFLDLLADGKWIFHTQAAIAAGEPINTTLDQNLQLISGVVRAFGDLTVNRNNPGNPILRGPW